MQRLKTAALLAGLLTASAGCDGKTGPVGPQGPAGAAGAAGPRGADGAPGARGPSGGPLVRASLADGGVLGPSYGLTERSVILRERYLSLDDGEVDLWVPRRMSDGRLTHVVDLYAMFSDCAISTGAYIQEGDALGGSVALNRPAPGAEPQIWHVLPMRVVRTVRSVRRGATGSCENLSSAVELSLVPASAETLRFPTGTIPMAVGPITLTPAE